MTAKSLINIPHSNASSNHLQQQHQQSKSRMTKSNTFFFFLGTFVTFIIMSIQMIFWETFISQTLFPQQSSSSSSANIGHTSSINTSNSGGGGTSSTSSSTRAITKSSVKGMGSIRGRISDGVTKRISSPTSGLYNYPIPKRTPQNILDETIISNQNSDSTTIDDDIFNCENEIYGKCQYFYPKEFFQTAVSSTKGNSDEDKSFKSLLTKLHFYKDNKYDLWTNMPFIGLWTIYLTPQWTNPITKQPFKEKRITFFHIHKTGGTSIVTHLRALKQKTQLPMNERKIFMYQTNKPLSQLNTKLQSQKETLETQLLNDIYPNAIIYPNSTTTTTTKRMNQSTTSITRWKEANSKKHVMFAIVRDPIDRFISAIGQAMGAFGSKTPLSKYLQNTCINSNVYTVESSRYTIQCVINFINDKDGFYKEVHFTPQAIEISFATGTTSDITATSNNPTTYNVPVAIFNYPQLKYVLEELGVPSTRKVRDGSSGEYRPKAVLQNMTTSDYTPELIQQVCILYEVDVIMMRSLGYPISRCDGII